MITLINYDALPLIPNSPARGNRLIKHELTARSPLLAREGPGVSSKKLYVIMTFYLLMPDYYRTVKELTINKTKMIRIAIVS